MTTRFAVAVLLFVLLAPSARAEEWNNGCATSPVVVGECKTLRGRMTACTGIPNLRVWVVSTRRILGVADAAGNVAGDNQIPKWLDERLFVSPPCLRAAWGEFTVCPLEPRAMQKVCVKSVGQIRVIDY